MSSPSRTSEAVVEIDRVLDDERDKLGLDANDQPAALCLSGGGIRSATFSLGVLQGLARIGRLRDFHYLSSVSGGSYIALWLATWIHRSPGGAAAVEQSLRDSIGNGESTPPIQRLRAYSSFLSPVRGLSADFVAIVAIYVRNLLLHWMMVLPIVFAMFLLPRILYALLLQDVGGTYSRGLWVIAAVTFFIAIVFASRDTSRTPPVQPPTRRTHVLGLFLLPVLIGSMAIVLAAPRVDFPQLLQKIVLAGTIIQTLGELVGRYVLVDRMDAWLPPCVRSRWVEPVLLVAASAATGAVTSASVLAVLYGAGYFFPDVALRTTLSFPLVLAALAFSNIVRAGISRRWTDEDVREWWGRASGIVCLVACAWLLLSAVVIQVPAWLLRWASTWSGWTAGVAGSGGIALAVATAIAGFWSTHGTEVKEKAAGLGRALGVRAMEMAAGASVLVLAVSASLLLGVFVNRASFLLTETPVVVAACGGYAESASAKCTAPCVATSEIQDCSYTISNREVCTALVGMAVSKPDAYVCEEARAICALMPLNKMLPFACNAVLSARADQVATKQIEPAASASHDATTSTRLSEGPRQPVKSTNGAVPQSAINAGKTIRDQLVEGNFAFDWLINHQISLLASWYPLLGFAAMLLLVGIGASFLFGANAFSLNSFYGNRLTRAYLGASRAGSRRPHPFTGFDKGDNPRLKDLAPCAGHEGSCLLPIVNTALNLVRPSGERLEWQERKAESFFMSPYYCGSKMLKFVRTQNYTGKRGPSVGRAMAISGAAAAPSMGYHSSPLVTLLMAFFNVRLGWWMPNPKRCCGRNEPLFGIGPIISEMFSKVGKENRFIYLSDGGHFENLGLYEMVRRRCRNILVVDAAYDPRYQYEDLENAIRKIRVDLGVSITFADGLLTPERARASGFHYCSGVIRYSELDSSLTDGSIVYIKPVLSGDEPVDVRRYAESTRSNGRVFPQQPTSDQFFDEAQFESYRELGLHSVLQAFSGAGRSDWPRPALLGSLPTSDAVPGGDTQGQPTLPKWAPSPPTKPSSSGLGAALNSLGSLGQAAMVASITAAVTVTGTVALKDPTVTLSNPNVTLDAAQVRMVLDTTGASVPMTVDGDVLAKSLSAFLQSSEVKGAREAFAKELAQELSQVKVKATLDGPLDPDLLKKVQGVIEAGSLVIVDLRDASKDLKVAVDPLRYQLKPAIVALDKAITSLNDSTKGLKAKLSEIQSDLRSIDGTVSRISPRQTVRGSDS